MHLLSSPDEIEREDAAQEIAWKTVAKRVGIGMAHKDEQA